MLGQLQSYSITGPSGHTSAIFYTSNQGIFISPSHAINSNVLLQTLPKKLILHRHLQTSVVESRDLCSITLPWYPHEVWMRQLRSL